MDIDLLVRPFVRKLREYKPGKPVELVQRERGTTAPFVKLASNENPYSPHDKVREALARALHDVNRYPESGCYYLVGSIADDLGISHEEVFFGNGSNEIIDLLVRAFLNSDENVIFATPSFVVYGMVCAVSGIKSIAIPCKEFKINLEAISAAVNDNTKMIFLCNPNNPTSTHFSDREFSAFLEKIPERILVLVDEAYYDYVEAGDYPDSLNLQKNRNTLIVLRTFSKMYSLAGIRVGYAIADKKIVQALHKVRQPFNVNRLAQTAAIVALKYKKEIQSVVKETVAERKRMRSGIQDLGCKCPPSQTNFLYVVPPPYEGDLCERLIDHGVIVRNMRPFGGEGNTFRVTVGKPEENTKFLEALENVLEH